MASFIGELLHNLPSAIQNFLGDKSHAYVYTQFIEQYLLARPCSQKEMVLVKQMLKQILCELKKGEFGAANEYIMRDYIAILTLLSSVGNEICHRMMREVEGEGEIDLVHWIGHLLHSSDVGSYQVGVLAAQQLLLDADKTWLLFSNTASKAMGTLPNLAIILASISLAQSFKCLDASCTIQSALCRLLRHSSMHVRASVWSFLGKRVAKGDAEWIYDDHYWKYLWDMFTNETEWVVLAAVIQFYLAVRAPRPNLAIHQPWTEWNIWAKLCLIIDQLAAIDTFGKRVFLSNALQLLRQCPDRVGDFGSERMQKILYLVQEGDWTLLVQVYKIFPMLEQSQDLLPELNMRVASFLGSDKPDEKYSLLCLLESLVKIDKKILLTFQVLLCECLESKDYSLRSKALTIMFESANSENCIQLVGQCAKFIDSCYEPYFVLQVLKLLIGLVERFYEQAEGGELVGGLVRFIKQVPESVGFGSFREIESTLANLSNVIAERILEGLLKEEHLSTIGYCSIVALGSFVEMDCEILFPYLTCIIYANQYDKEAIRQIVMAISKQNIVIQDVDKIQKWCDNSKHSKEDRIGGGKQCTSYQAACEQFDTGAESVWDGPLEKLFESEPMTPRGERIESAAGEAIDESGVVEKYSVLFSGIK